MEKITPNDIRYNDLANKRFNKRYKGKPDYIRLPRTTDEVIAVLQEAVDEKRRVTVRSGGHCLEGFVSDPTVQVLIDMSLMTNLYYDTERKAFAVEAGVTVGEMYRRLFLQWGVVLPAGEHPGIGIGGHILGGAFGFLCREYGLAADYLYAVELVSVDFSGKVHATIATREDDDLNRELWWAHTGGGGGNFGIVTKYWVRSQHITSDDPHTALPKAPTSMTTFTATWEWKDIDETSFTTIVRNFGNWCLDNALPASRYSTMCCILFLNHRNIGKIELKGVSTASAAEIHIEEVLHTINQNLTISCTRVISTSGWLQFALNPFPELFQPGAESVPCKVKDALLRRPFTEKQIATAYKYLTAEVSIGGVLGMATYGGKVNTIKPDATASPQRDSILDMACNTGWTDPNAAEASLSWVRSFYSELFETSGGVPVPNEQADGSMINHPDSDMATETWNKSGVPWHTLYYKDNYPRLQRVKREWDPLNIFHHILSVQREDAR